MVKPSKLYKIEHPKKPRKRKKGTMGKDQSQSMQTTPKRRTIRKIHKKSCSKTYPIRDKHVI
jgi:hypothetical protein